MQQESTPEHVVVTPVGQADIIGSNRTKLIWGLVCLIGPTALLIVTILGYALINFMVGGDDSAGRTILNILLFLVGVVVVLTLLPGFIAGIILLATRKKVN